MHQRELLILVPARGGSKGLPRKNARQLGDIPLLGWTAEAVRASGIAGDASVVLSTDDDIIAEIGRTVGLETPFLRPAELATDTASAVDVVLHCLKWFEDQRRMKHRAAMLLQPTSPFRPPTMLTEGWRMFEQGGSDAVLGVKSVQRSLSALFRAGDSNRLTPVSEAPASTRRQDTEPLYTPNGALYLVRTEVLHNERSFFPSLTRGLTMDRIASLDIDDPVDWALAEAVVSARLSWRHN